MNFPKVFNRIVAMLMSGIMTASIGTCSAFAEESTAIQSTAFSSNYAAALQDALYFYDANKCGDGITGGNLEWRGDCHLDDATVPLIPMGEDHIGTNLSQDFIDQYQSILDPDGDGTMDLTGGWHDAGDCVKFGLPGSYAASTVGWGYYEFRDAYEDTGLQWHVEDLLRWINDYYLKCTFLDENGEVVAFCYQVGEGDIDHNYWITPELQSMDALLDYARPAYFATVDTPASDMCAGTAASLAINYLNFKETDPDYAKQCLDTALALYRFAVKTHAADGKSSLGYDGGFYESSYDFDELAWAAVWLYTCTEDWSYIDSIISQSDVQNEDGSYNYTGYLSRIIVDTGNDWQNIWVHCWDTVWGGVFAKLAPITNTERDWYIFRWNLEYWSGIEHEDPSDTTFLAKTPAGFSMLNNYGSCRYNAAAQMCAAVYAKETGDKRFSYWAVTQMDYILGNNPMGYSYLVGYGDQYASHPHHRASHGSTTLNMDDPVDQVHILWGALVGGPDETDKHVDLTKDYIYNEVAVDYNAAFTGALAGLYDLYGKARGDKILENFPPSERDYKENIQEFSLEAAVGQEDNMASQVQIKIHNNTILPPRYLDHIKVRYYFNISELLKNGQSLEDISVRMDYDEEKANSDGKTAVSYQMKQYNKTGDCYIEFMWDHCIFYGKRTIQFALMAEVQNADYQFIWDASNDYSRDGLTWADGEGILFEEALKPTQKITMYVDDKLVWGIEPADSSDPIDNNILYGDVNLDGTVTLADMIRLNQYLSARFDLNDTAQKNANCDLSDPELNDQDLKTLLYFLIDRINQLPVKS